MKEQMNKEQTNKEETTKEKNYIYLKAFAIIFYVIAVALIIYGIFSIVGYAYTIVSDSQSNWFVENNFFNPDDFADKFEDGLEHLNISGMIKGFEFIIGGVVCIVVGSILIKNYNKKTYKAQQKVEEEDAVNFIDTVRVTISEQLKKASEKISPAVDQKTETEEKEEKKPKQKIYCAYCGSELDENDKKCPSCGASKKFRK